MNIKMIRPTAKIPTKGSDQAAGYDLYAAFKPDTLPNGQETPGSVEIPPHETRLVPTGLAMAIPHGWWGGIFARSGLATKQGLRPANCVGVIDSDYRGEIFVALHNDTDKYRYVHCGDRIAQLLLFPCFMVEEWIVVDELDETDRGEGGFGSTGIK